MRVLYVAAGVDGVCVTVCFVSLIDNPWTPPALIFFAALSVCLSVCLSICLSVCRSVYLAGWLSVCPSVCPSGRPSVCLYLSVCQSVCLSVSLRLCSSPLHSPAPPTPLNAYPNPHSRMPQKNALQYCGHHHLVRLLPLRVRSYGGAPWRQASAP